MEMDTESLRKSFEAEIERSKRDGSDGKEQKILGGLLSVSAPIASMVNSALNYFKPAIRRWAEESVHSLGRGGRGTKIAADAVGWGIIFYDELIGLGGDVNKYYVELRDVKQTLSKVSVSNGGSADSFDGLKNNEIVTVEKKRAATHFKQGLSYDAAKLIASVPQAYIKMEDKKHGAIKPSNYGSGKGKHESEEEYVKRTLEAEKHNLEQLRLDELKAEAQRKYVQEMVAGDTSLSDEAKERVIRKLNATLNNRGRQQDEGKQKKPNEDFNNALSIIGTAGSEIAKDAVSKRKSDMFKTTALDMIQKLTDTVIEDKNATSVKGVPIEKSFEKYIVDIFNTHQRNMGEPEVGKRFAPKLEEAAKEIAKAITDGKLHPMALVNLVGERKIIKDKGKKFATHSEIEALIAEQEKKMPAHFSVDVEDYVKESALGEQGIKAALDKTQGDTRAFVMARLPEEVAKKVATDDDEYKQAVEAAKPHEKENIRKSLLDLGSQSDEVLKDKAKLTKEEITQVRKLAPLAEKGEMDEVMQAVGVNGQRKGDFKTLDFTIVNAAPLLFADGRSPGALFEQAGGKLYEKPEPEQEFEREDADMGFGRGGRHGYGHEDGEGEELHRRPHSHHDSKHTKHDRASSFGEDDEMPDSHIRHAQHSRMQRDGGMSSFDLGS